MSEHTLAKVNNTPEKADEFRKRLRALDTKPRMGVYAGSFNPFHKGHENILDKALDLFDRVVILKAQNPEKVEMAAEEYAQMQKLRSRLAVEVDFLPAGQLLTDYLKGAEDAGFDVTLIRGLRNGTDLDYEQNQQFYLQTLYPQLKTVFLLCDPQNMFLSSKSIRALEKLSPDAAQMFKV